MNGVKVEGTDWWFTLLLFINDSVTRLPTCNLSDSFLEDNMRRGSESEHCLLT